ncbi:hypothetical protein ACGRHY_27955 [Streptomyces sp. HK10]|uniref:hypothetical protein n=1 Tax=Streptomyces sp. HK10 TaxID=3373255 RepID=UPI00374A5C30
MSFLSMRRLRRRLTDFPLPEPFSIDGLVANLEAQSGRRITLIELNDRATDLRTACGLRARAESHTYIFYRRRPTENQTSHTVLHELAHEFFDHGTNLSSEQFEGLVPSHIRRNLIDRLGAPAVVQARARYDSVEEREAELSASLIKDLVRRQGPQGDDMVSLLENSLSHPVAPLRRRK